MTTTSQPAISVIMPVFNGSKFLQRSVGSLSRQTFPEWELVAVDDGSTDDSYQQLCRYAASDSRIRAFSRPGDVAVYRGPSAARNCALRQARGAVITYLDQDDEYYPDYLSDVHAWQSKAGVLMFAYDLLEERPEMPGCGQSRVWDPMPCRALLLQENIVTPLGVAHPRSLLDTVGLFREEAGVFFEEDTDLWGRFARAGVTFLFLPLKSGRFHVRPESLSRTRQKGLKQRRAAAAARGPQRGRPKIHSPGQEGQEVTVYARTCVRVSCG